MKTKFIPSLRSLTLAVTILLLVAVPNRSPAAFVFTLTQTGGNVVVTGSGTINLTALTLQGTTNGTPNSSISPSIGELRAGNSGATQIYAGFTGPTSFGSGATTNGTGTGNAVEINGVQGFLFVPSGYVSGTTLSDTATFANTAFSSLSFTPGTYVYTWGTGATADSLTVTSVVPEPSTWVLSVAGMLMLGVALRRRRA